MHLPRRALLLGVLAALGMPTVNRHARGQVPRVVEARLEAGRARVTVAGQTVELLTYNGLFPGPLLRAAGGDLLRLELANALDEPTNLHFHGLHVTPGGIGDNVFRAVPPGGRAMFELRLAAGSGERVELLVPLRDCAGTSLFIAISPSTATPA